MTPRQICATKVRFRTKAEARASRDRHRRNGYRYFLYACEFCRGVHLTHTAPGDWRATKRHEASSEAEDKDQP